MELNTLHFLNVHTEQFIDLIYCEQLNKIVIRNYFS